jgi:Zn-dependent peptidase ImmA (M78 family)
MSLTQLCGCERGERALRPSEVEKIAKALRFPTRFFESDCRVIGALGEVQFRKKSTAYAGQRRKAVAEMNCGSLLAASMSDMLGNPPAKLELRGLGPTDFHDSPAFAAHSVARGFQLPPGPIRNLTETVEDAGVFVFVFDMGEDIFGLSHWPSDRHPVICINSRMSGDRYRWTLAHELGHLAMHAKDADVAAMERQADEFAAELLMPKDDIYASLRGLSLHRLRDLKHEWGVSMQALIRRAFELGLLSDYEMKRYFTMFAKRGWRKREPEVLQHEASRLVPGMRRELAERLVTTSALAEALGLPDDLLAHLTAVVHGPTKQHLRLVEGGDSADPNADLG